MFSDYKIEDEGGESRLHFSIRDELRKQILRASAKFIRPRLDFVYNEKTHMLTYTITETAHLNDEEKKCLRMGG
jgi:DNA-binding transcriptional regulator PaaX